jgi:hypothetical protein
MPTGHGLGVGGFGALNNAVELIWVQRSNLARLNQKRRGLALNLGSLGLAK